MINHMEGATEFANQRPCLFNSGEFASNSFYGRYLSLRKKSCKKQKEDFDEYIMSNERIPERKSLELDDLESFIFSHGVPAEFYNVLYPSESRKPINTYQKPGAHLSYRVVL